MKVEQGKWYTVEWKGPEILVEYWNGSIKRTTLAEAELNQCG